MMTSAETTDIAVVGAAGRFPGARSLDEFWRNLRDGVESVTFFDDDELIEHGVPREHLEAPNYVRAAPTLDEFDRFDARFFGYNAREAALIDPQQRLFLETAWAALEDAGHTPGGFDGAIGVYAATNLSTYLLNNIVAGRGLPPGGDSLEMVVANDKDYVASRTAYKLGLSGPAVAVQTACSSSLTAVHTAVVALLGFECDMAIAGGATLRCPQRTGYFHREGMIFSRDGHCRPFDADASGTLAGSGVGAVVLKRLDDALADGDHVDAVIKGSAVNNDGADKIGYTAPSVRGQAHVVSAALAVAEVDPATIAAIEAHGTGTQLGDPIEVRALSEAFAEDGPSRCAIGSVKGNIGHLDSSAGIAGLLKAVLQVRHGELVPSVNYTGPNARIDFDATPFRVNTRLRKWPTDGVPRRMGVSSFGIGGTNAHVVLEEGVPRLAPPDPLRALTLVTVSARTAEALDRASARLADALDAPDRPALADVAYTLQVGRTSWEHARVLVARDEDDAAELLRGGDPRRVSSHARTGEPGIALLFPGQGSQYPDMGLGLYRHEPVFRQEVDRCADLLGDQLGLDLRDVLLPGLRGGDADAAASRLTATELAQPALFTVEYALAELLDSWGVRADAMLGHSVGEITAACRAGVFGIEDAARLVAVRGRLMQEMPPGAMVSVRLAEDHVRGELPEGLALAAVNAPDLCVVSGPADAVAAQVDRWAEQGVEARELHTSHAFHSSMMDGMLDRFAEQLAGLEFREPRTPYVANATGTWVGRTDPAYWVEQARRGVRFADGVRSLVEDGPRTLVEVGPGRTLGTLARANGLPRGCTVLACLPGPGEHGDEDDQESLLRMVGQLWMSGADVDPAVLQGDGRRRVSLPTYPFERRRYWIEPEATGATGTEPAIAVPEDVPPVEITLSDADPRPMLGVEYVAPRDVTEERVAAVWQDLLGVSPVGVHDPFVELGGHSLLAARVLARVNEELGSEITPRMMFDDPTVAGVAALVGVGIASTQDSGRDGLPAAAPDPANSFEPFPLTEIQQAQWIGRLASFDIGNVAAHAYWEVELDGVDLDRLEDAFGRLVERHGMLRAVVLTDGTQQILPDVGPYRFERLDLSGEPEDVRDRELARLRDELSHEVRPTETWPLFTVRATLLPDDHVRLHLGFDLLIADIGSIRILLRDWRRIYQDGIGALAPLELSYRDYALAAARVRETSLYERALAYWRERVQDLPPGPDLPLATSPAALSRPEFRARQAVVPRAVWDGFVSRAARLGVTGSAALLAVYAYVIGTWCRSGRFTLNVTLTNRLDVHPDVSELVGEFASFDLLPVDLTARDGVGALARRLQEQAWEDLDYRYVNGVEVLREMARRGGTGAATMPVVFTSTLVQQNDPGDASMFGWLGRMSHEVAQTPQVWMDAGVLEVADGMQLSWHGVRQLFPDNVLDEMFEQFRDLVDTLAVDDETWGVDPGPLLPAAQRELLAAVNDTAGAVPEGFLHGPVVEQAAERPDATAVVAPEGTLTFGELYLHACHVARRLRELGVGPNQLVAIGIDKGCEQIVAALGVLLSGGAYLPVDPDLPDERRTHLLEHGRARVVLSRVDGPATPLPDGVREVVVDLDADVADGGPPEQVARPTDLAYVIYTSGSTGEPKGAMLAHRSSLNTLVDINERFGVGPGDRVLGLSSLSFDLSVWDVFGVLGAGGTLVLPESGARRDPDRWLDLVTTHGVTVWNTVPALMQMFADHLAGRADVPAVPLRLALLSGDWIPVDLPDRIRSAVPEVEVISLGGATEAAVWSIYYPIAEVDPEWDSIPYGRPLRNQAIHVLNDRLQPCPVWTPGELYIGGVGVAEGYWRDEERTAASFVVHPDTGERIYRTGDLGRRLPDGDVEFLGREDFQVKVGGFRIELGEIESALLRCDGVGNAVAAAVGDRHHRSLAAYVVPAGPGENDDLVDRAFAAMGTSLPSYMVPSTVTVLERLPLTGNGKVDRGALPVPGGDVTPGDADADVDDPTARRLCEITAGTLGLEAVAPGQNFFEIGGDSIKGIQIVSAATAEGLEITAADLFERQTVAGLACALRERGAAPVAVGDTVALSPLQRTLFDRSAPGTPGGCHRLELPLDPSVSDDTVEAAVRMVVERHDALRLRFVAAGSGWEQTVADDDPDAAYVPSLDLSALPEDRRPSAGAQMVAEMAAELDPVHGPLARAALLDLGSGRRRLVWLVHEAAVDTSSWGTLLADLSGVLAGREPGGPGPSFLRWSAAAARSSQSSAAEREGLPDRAVAAAADAFHGLDTDPAGSPHREERVADVPSLLDDAWDAYRMTPEEVCLAVLAHAARDEGERLVVDVEHDLRETLGEGVGAVAGLVPLVLDLDAADPADLVTQAKEGYRAAVDRAERSVPDAAAPVRLRAVLRLAGTGPVPDLDPGTAPGPLMVTPVPTGNGLRVVVTGRGGPGTEAAVARLADALEVGASALAEHYRSGGTGRVSATDFPLADLDDDDLSSFLQSFADDATTRPGRLAPGEETS